MVPGCGVVRQADGTAVSACRTASRYGRHPSRAEDGRDVLGGGDQRAHHRSGDRGRPDPRRRHRGRGTAGAGHFVLLGDNLDESVDSRLFGPVPGHRIVGRARPLR
ncbi:S26 family signal peptidase [Catellatospora bangladeshensis]|uniref:S26 family signal peptidase n=1 Tax=Catellatospora bangladeshensis TaxID=310355 RepID=UPI003623CC7A